MFTTETRLTSAARWAIATCLVIMLASPSVSGAQSRFSGVVVFGTSLSDPGNAFALRGDQATPHDFMLNPLLIPSAPYAWGGHHFSNGPTWIEQYARSVGLGGSVTAALATTDSAATNYAVGAARAYEDGINFNLTRQVDTFLVRNGGIASPHALYAIEMGSNDVRDAFASYATGGDGGLIIGQAIASIAGNIQRLYAAGAREFLIWSVPNVALTPAVRSLGPVAGGLATQVTLGFNAALAQVVGQLTLAPPGSQFRRLDAFQLLNAIVADPGSFVLTNVTTACVTPNVAPFHCSNPAEFLFWDGIHPSRAGHALLAGQAAVTLQ